MNSKKNAINWGGGPERYKSMGSPLFLRIMINKHEYKTSVKDIMDKYYEMFRGKNRGNKTDFFNSPEDVEDLDTDG